MFVSGKILDMKSTRFPRLVEASCSPGEAYYCVFFFASLMTSFRTELGRRKTSLFVLSFLLSVFPELMTFFSGLGKEQCSLVARDFYTPWNLEA